MGCRCNERGQHIARATAAIRAGDLKTATDQLAEIGQTFRKDAADIGNSFRSKVEAARTRLAIRR